MVRLTEIAERLLKAAVIVLMGLMTGLVLLQVVLRSFFGQSIPGNEEMTRYMFVYVIFLAAAVGVRRGVHVNIDVLQRRLSSSWGRLVENVSKLLVGLFLLFLLIMGAELSWSAMGQNSPALGISMGYAYGAIPLGAAFGLLFLLVPAKGSADTIAKVKA